MIARRVWNTAFVAGLALLSGCAVTQGQLDARLNQQTAEMHSYVDQKVDAILKAVQSQGSDVRQNREVLRSMIEAQSEALEQQKRTVDALIEHLKAGPLTSAPTTPTTR